MQWSGRCPGCGGWGTVERTTQVTGGARSRPGPDAVPLLASVGAERRVKSGLAGVDRVLGGGLVEASVNLLAGEPGIGKSTLLLQLVAGLSAAGHRCLLVSGEESLAQVSARARRLGLSTEALTFAPGRDLAQVIELARKDKPFLLAVDSIQTIRDTSATHTAGGVSSVRECTDAMVGMAKAEGIAVLLTGHVTKDGDLAGPKALEHAVDVVAMLEARSTARILSATKNRYGAEGESAWFEMLSDGMHEIDPAGLLLSGEQQPGAATALPLSGRRALAVEVQALVGTADGQARRQATGLDQRRFLMVAAVLERAGINLGRADLFGASSGGLRVDDPACDLAVAIAIASAATGLPPPPATAFVGEVALTGSIRSVPGLDQRLSAAGAAVCPIVFAPAADVAARSSGPITLVPVRSLAEAVKLALRPVENLPSGGSSNGSRARKGL
jgi:DNA repair protein RadA/Sms